MLLRVQRDGIAQLHLEHCEVGARRTVEERYIEQQDDAEGAAEAGTDRPRGEPASKASRVAGKGRATRSEDRERLLGWHGWDEPRGRRIESGC